MIWFKEEDNELSFEANETIYVYVNYEGRYNLSKFLKTRIKVQIIDLKIRGENK